MSRSSEVLIIAEAGVNHNGSPERALQLVDAAADAGGNVVKFQTFDAARMISRHAPKAAYQQATTGTGGNQLEMVRQLELSHAAHLSVLERCRQRSVQFASSPFDIDSARFLVNELGVDWIKLGSGEITNAPLLLEVARLGKPVILSTGMSTLADVENALGVLAFGYLGLGDPRERAFAAAYGSSEGQGVLRERVTLLHCTTEYPAPFEQVNLRAMDTLATAFGLPVGFSDHTPGITAAVAAVARGARVVEKHFTLDKALPGPDHRASLEPGELHALVAAVRQVEACLGDPIKRPTAAEIGNRAVARKSLVAARAIRAGEAYSPDNVTFKRPGTGLSPLLYWDIMGRVARRDYVEDEALDS